MSQLQSRGERDRLTATQSPFDHAREPRIYLTDLHFTPDPDACDEGRLPWDFAGSEVWDPPQA